MLDRLQSFRKCDLCQGSAGVRECGSAGVLKLGSLEVLLSLTGTGISAKGFNPGGKSRGREVGGAFICHKHKKTAPVVKLEPL